ncbi:WD40 repeat domain-containing protein [Streptomyces milbemycinicus]|uniref:WD40 repeat domain-containing protein n=1 Tax=Streptomyces milbemycinicus TaxID=476552 RepID=UPI0033E088DE
MDLRGKSIVLMGRFHKLPQATAKAGLEALGARVSGSVSDRTDLVFVAHDVPGRKIGAASTRGIPIYDAKALRAVLKGAAEPSAGDESATDGAGTGTFADHASLTSAADPAALLAVLQGADWSAFVAERDLPPLRARLLKLERTHGVTEAHRFATDRIRGLGDTRLQHPYGHSTEITSFDLSPCGRYLATGSWVGDDYHRGGALQIWEVASGRCVNTLQRIEGGVGWPDYDDAIQWSADSTRVGLAYNTNQVGVFDPFDTHTTNTYPLASASVTDGASRPPTWALAPDGRRAFVSTASSSSIKGCVVPLEAGRLFWLPHYAPPSHPYLLPETLPEKFGHEEDELWLDDGVSWSRDGTRLYAYIARRRRDLVIDLATRQVGWATEEDGPESAAGKGGGGGVRVSVDSTRVTFHRPDTGGKSDDFTFLREPPGPRLLEDDYVLEQHNVNFALDDHTWCAAFEEGVVIAPPDRREDLDAVLTWSVDRRFGWPVRWGGLDVVPDVRTAAERLGEDGLGYFVREYVERMEPAEAQGDGAWPPPNTATLDDLFTAVKDAVSELGSNWNFAVNEYLSDAARLRARRGEPEGAAQLLDAIPGTDERVAASAQVAMILARAGHTEQARAVFAFAEPRAEAALGKHNAANVASSVAGAYQALGDTAAADAWFARARDAIEPETNPWENRLPVIWALTECGRVDEARSLWASAENRPNSFRSEPWLLCLLSTDRLDIAEEFLEACVPSGMDRPSSMIKALVELGRPDLLRSWLSDSWYIPDESYERAQAIADGAPRRSLPPTPTEEDIAALAEAHAKLLKTPRAKRQMPTVELLEQAADCGHLSAVLNLLGDLPAHDFNHRPKTAFSALWRAATGHYQAQW